METIINGVKCRMLEIGEIIQPTDVFNNGHKVEFYSIGTEFQAIDKEFYQVYRKV